MSTIGRKLLSAALYSGNVHEFMELSLAPVLFKESEGVLYSYIKEHLQKYGKLPSPSTIEEQPGLEGALVDAPEPPEFYLQGVERRYLQNSMKAFMNEAGAVLKEEGGDPMQAFDILLNGVSNLNRHRNRHNLIDFRDSAELIYDEYVKQKTMGDDYGLMFGWPSVDEMTGGLKPGDFASFVGRPACLSGDTKIWVSRKKDSSGRVYTLKQLYERFNGAGIPTGVRGNNMRYWDGSIPTRVNSLRSDGFTGLNTVNAVVSSGMKTTYTVVTSTGKSIRATMDHQFKTADGFKKLSALSVGDTVVCRAEKQVTKPQKSRPVKERCGKYPHSPYRTRVVAGKTYQRVSTPRLVYDAGLNGVHPDDLLTALATDPSHGFVFSPQNHEIHHKDGDPSNNEFANLECLPGPDHQRLHNAESPYVRRFGAYEVAEEVIVSIDLFGEEETYDIAMNYPDNNFVANDFVVHNSGKTFKLLYNALHTWSTNKTPLFFSMEMAKTVIMQRMAAMHAHKPLTHLMKAEMTTKAFTAMMEILKKVKEKQESLWIVDGNLATTVDDIIMLTRQLKPSAIYVDGAYLLRHPNLRTSRFERQTENAEWLKQRVATDLGIPVVASYQFGKEMVKKQKASGAQAKAGLEDIYGSDAIAQLSTMVFGLMQEDSVETQKERIVEILKGRNGETGRFKINWDFQGMDFSEKVSQEDEEELMFCD